MKKILFLCLGLSLSCATYAQQLVFKQQDLQQQVEQRMPIVKQQPLYTLVIKDPELTLLATTQRISLAVRLNLATPLGFAANGWAQADGVLRYNSKDYGFYLDDPVLTELHIDELPSQFKPQVQALVQEMLASFLADAPVYQLSGKNFHENMAKMMLKNISVKEDAIVAELGLF